MEAVVTTEAVRGSELRSNRGFSDTVYISLRFNGHFPAGPGLAGTSYVSILDFTGAEGDGGVEWWQLEL